MSPREIEALAERLFTAIAVGDADTVAACYHPDVQIWHNHSGRVQGLDENLKMLRWLNRTITGFKYDAVERTCFEGGFVQRHVLRGTVVDQTIEAPTCMVGQVRDGKVFRLHEYMDSAHIAPLLRR
ncbi:MAG TPA: nuclear transport factor 2 family protein [Steroidobacter sp.]|nr:nuclear transport factor 2 family protein [Steroidobacter sp.]